MTMMWPDEKTFMEWLGVVVPYLYIIAPCVVVTASVTWWGRGLLAKSSINGLKEQNEALKQRMELAHDRERAAIRNAEEAARKANELEDHITLLRRQLDSGSTDDAIVTSDTVATVLDEIKTANSAISQALDDWPLRRLFSYLAPHLPLKAHKVLPGGGIVGDVDERWKSIGQLVLNELSRDRLRAGKILCLKNATASDGLWTYLLNDRICFL